jgi:hypothetical protein
MAKAFDCAAPLTFELAAKFKADGYDAVGRYLVPDGWKRLTKDEANAISQAGLTIISIFETTADRTKGGAPAGSQDGAVALQCAQNVGQPTGSAIYFAVDYDAGPGDIDAIEAYLRAASAAAPGYEVGVYGSYAVVEEMRRRGACTKFIQTYAWSSGLRSDAAQIFQYQNDITVNGIGVDLDDLTGDEGGWSTMQVPQLSPEVANNIINSYLSTTWQSCENQRMQAVQEGRTADAESWMRLRDWQHYLANELRKASGQPVQ